MQLQFRTRGSTTPQGKPHIYVCSHPEDHARYFEETAKTLLRHCDCAVCYFAPDACVSAAEREAALAGVQLVVVSVTDRLFEGCAARDSDLPFALAHRIPVLPLLQEKTSDTRFAQYFGDLQYLSPHTEDATAVPYADKLQKYLSSVLSDDETVRQVREEFDAYLFLSYRKKNRREAQELMHLIHTNENYRDLAIWYDEFLTPGEDFGEAIRLAMHNSVLVVLTVTPDLLEEGNYVAAHEYPAAMQNKLPIIPFEMRKTDRAALERMYPLLPDCIDPHDPDLVVRTLDRAFCTLNLRRKQSPEHDFRIGLAYLEGIDVETDNKRAVELIRSAAEAGLTEATEKMVNMYASGQGVARDIAAATEWKQRLILCRFRDFQNDPNEQSALRLIEEQRDLADVLIRTDAQETALTLYRQVAEIALAISDRFPSAEASQHRAAALQCLAHAALSRENHDEAIAQYKESERELNRALHGKGVKIGTSTFTLTAPSDRMTVVLMSDLCTCLCGLGDALVARGQAMYSVENMEDAQTCYDRAAAYLQSEHLKDLYFQYAAQLSAALDRKGNMEYMRGNDDEARRYYEQALRIDEQRLQGVSESHDNEAWDSFAVSCFRLAMFDPEHPDRAYLTRACEIWRRLCALVPEMTVYAERLREAESVLSMLPPPKGTSSVSAAVPTPAPKPTPVSTAQPKNEGKPSVPSSSKPAPAVSEPPPAPVPAPVAPPTAEQTFAALLSAAEGGDLQAMFDLSSCYYFGNGTEQDYFKAAEWAAKSLMRDGRKQSYRYQAYTRIVYCMFELPENAVGYSNYKNASGWAKQAARQGEYEVSRTMAHLCKRGRYRSIFRVLYWKLYAVYARMRYC